MGVGGTGRLFWGWTRTLTLCERGINDMLYGSIVYDNVYARLAFCLTLASNLCMRNWASESTGGGGGGAPVASLDALVAWLTGSGGGGIAVSSIRAGRRAELGGRGVASLPHA